MNKQELDCDQEHKHYFSNPSFYKSCCGCVKDSMYKSVKLAIGFFQTSTSNGPLGGFITTVNGGYQVIDLNQSSISPNSILLTLSRYNGRPFDNPINADVLFCNIKSAGFLVNSDIAELFSGFLVESYPNPITCNSNCCCNQYILDNYTNENNYFFDITGDYGYIPQTAAPINVYGRVIAYDCNIAWVYNPTLPAPYSSYAAFYIVSLCDVNFVSLSSPVIT